MSAVRQTNQKSVLLTTSQQVEGDQYTITISNVKDIAAAPNTMAQAQKQFTALFKFEDDFESGTIGKWTPATSSNWSVVDDAGDKSLFISTLTPEKLLVDRIYTVMSFDADIKGFSTGTYRNVSVVFGYKDATNYYHMNFGGSTSSAYNGIYKVVNGTETKLSSPLAGLLTDVVQYHHIRVTWDAGLGDIRAYFDQSATPVCTAVDQTHTSGQVGVWSKTKQAYIDNVEVVARVRTDSFGLTAVRGQILAGNKDVAPHRYTGPNPVNSITEIRQLEQLQGAIIYDLSGRRVDIKETRHNGIYLLRAAGTTLLQKIVLMKQ